MSMSDAILYGVAAIIVLSPLVIIGWALALEWRADRRADDTPPGDHAHHPDSLRNARRANRSKPDA
jgi:hypothetical protein